MAWRNSTDHVGWHRTSSGDLLSTLAVATAAIGFGSVAYFAKSLSDAGMAPVAVAFYRYLFVGVLLLPFLRITRNTRSATLWAAIAGAAMGLGWTGYVRAIELMPVSTVAVLYMTYPMFTVLVAWLALAQRPTGLSLIASALIVLAAALVTAPTGSATWSAAGLICALAAPLTFAIAITILATKLGAIPPLSRIAGVGLGAVLALAPLVLALPIAAIVPQEPAHWGKVAGICLVTALGPQLLYVIHSPRVGPAKSAMLGGLELPTMLAIGWFAFAETIEPAEILAAALVLGAIAITPTTRRPTR